ncbi:thiolase family protein [Frankia sp. CNm7]|uniref:Thiolase family protein n=1 Tax=Frankia nepalensis TaxID=1836974 RepID=A0A937RMI5_9ACTN|nr:thiolase family protein [Frankia nepalensis]MBL7500200.1 thiolase family protein [Frankia nepalensis]MBL7509420.1 thiolase family protein [Frankia nepalensis]MBL7522768.1 thiolase family protein [Frankia nepalensis]MBL7631630.1 thiolase family protein [Frankia nepalensis]
MDDVAIIGVGRTPFGRFPGQTAIQLGAQAVRAALTDAGLEWKQIQFGFAGSFEVDNPDAVINFLGLTGIPITDVYNGCATAASALTQAANTIRLGEYDLGIAVGMDKHPTGAFASYSEEYGLPAWYGETGLFLTPKFFAMKIQRYMYDHGISPRTLAKVAAKNYRNGSISPLAFRRTPMSEEKILTSRMVNDPLTQYMFCSPDEGAAAVILCRASVAHRYTSKPIYLKASVVRTRKLGAFEVHSPWLPLQRADAPTVFASRAAYEMAGLGPDDVDVAQLQDTDAGAEVIHLAENGLCKDGEQERLYAEGATEIGGSIPVNTDGGLIANGEPIGASGLRQVYELTQQLRGTAGDRQVPGTPRVGYGQLYGAPGTAGVAILST